MNPNNFYVKSLYISNFKPFQCKYPPQEIAFTDKYGESIQFMMLSGFNGYGKTSIFQAIEFILNGKIGIFQFKDTTKKYSEHITINELNKESLLALEVINKSTNQYISIIRYNECVKPCKEKECLEEDKNFELYILNESFDYESFKQKLKNREIEKTTTNDLAKVLNENSLDEWLATNYLKQEQSSNILFKNNKDRVDFINQFIDQDNQEYFSKFTQEDEELSDEIKKLTDELKSLKESINKNQVKSIGEKPKSFVLFRDQGIIWDKEDYNSYEDFETYLKGLGNLKAIAEKLDIYVATDKYNGIKKLLDHSDLLKKILIFSCFQGKIDTYINEYNKKKYLINISADIESMLLGKLDNQYLDDDLIKRIVALKKKAKESDELASNKQKMYTKLKNIREQIISDIRLVEEMFDETCPLCGHNYLNEELKLAQAIENHENFFTMVNNLMDENDRLILESIDLEFQNLKKDIASLINSIQIEEQMYDYFVNISEKINEFYGYEERLNYFMNESVKDYSKDMQLDTSSLNRIFDELVKKLQSLSEEYAKIVNDNPLSDAELINLDGNRKYLKVLIDNSNEELLNNLEQKELLLQWYLSKSQLETHSKKAIEFKESFSRLKELYVRSKKIKKLLECVKSAKNQYMNDLIKYIEIPLYIYSGKLMQTHQNGLGVFCTTGSSEDKVTQFKLTTNGDVSGHDIINKFSSGQKAVMNIAVILAFRKIRVASFDLFMIDDPCQSMDDINIASLTEIFRNELGNTQILISTHDDSTAGYMCYKYYKSGKNYRNLNVQKEFYTIKAD